MSEVKAIIKLATGNVGFYDNLTRIHLTIAKPTAKVYHGMNVTNLLNGVACKTIEVLEGSLTSIPAMDLGPATHSTPMQEITPADPVPQPQPQPQEVVEPQEDLEPEGGIELLAEEEEETKKPKKTSKKRTSKKTSSTEESESK